MPNCSVPSAFAAAELPMALMVKALAPVAQVPPGLHKVLPVIVTLTPELALVARVYCAFSLAYAVLELRAPVVESPSVRAGAVPQEDWKTQKVSVSNTLEVILMLEAVLRAI